MSQASELLHLAAGAMGKTDGVMVGRWPRTAAALGRQAIEAALSGYWQRVEPSVAASSMRAQLLCLPTYAGDGPLAGELASAWASLSAACHYHPYDLPPSESELRAWLTAAARFDAMESTGR